MITVLGDRLLIKPLELKKEHKVEGTSFAIQIAYGDNEKRYEAATTEGHVVSIGSEAYKSIGDGTWWVQPGDYVLFGKYTGYWIKDPETNESYVILDQTDVLCKITKGDAK